MDSIRKKKLAMVTIVYWFLLGYILAALVWWFIALSWQNHQAALYKLEELKADDPQFLGKIDLITSEEKRKQTQYVLEGLTFLGVIGVGAVFVYRVARRQIKMAQQQQNFMMAITHELKTPIAVAKLNLETLQKHKLDESRQQKLIQSTLHEANRLNTLTNNILISSQLEAGAYTEVNEELDFSLLVSGSLQDFQRRYPERIFENRVESDIDINGDSLLLQILVNNLLDNAIKYSPAAAPVSLELNKQDHTIRLAVADQGPGIPDGEKKNIFQRFYRIGNEQVRKTTGTGLGLYLCKKIASDHGADIAVTNNHPSGSIFTVHFKI